MIQGHLRHCSAWTVTEPTDWFSRSRYVVARPASVNQNGKVSAPEEEKRKGEKKEAKKKKKKRAVIHTSRNGHVLPMQFHSVTQREYQSPALPRRAWLMNELPHDHRAALCFCAPFAGRISRDHELRCYTTESRGDIRHTSKILQELYQSLGPVFGSDITAKAVWMSSS